MMATHWHDAQKLASYLRKVGIDPQTIPGDSYFNEDGYVVFDRGGVIDDATRIPRKEQSWPNDTVRDQVLGFIANGYKEETVDEVSSEDGTDAGGEQSQRGTAGSDESAVPGGSRRGRPPGKRGAK